jgi:succinate dehydrogenase hydrophobic anchor subunit
MYCTRCGNEMLTHEKFCTICGHQSERKPLHEIEKELRFVLPMATPIFAVAAGYLGLFSVLIFPAPLALIFGILGLRQINAEEHAYGRVRCWVGIILGGLFSVLLLWIIVVMIVS